MKPFSFPKLKLFCVNDSSGVTPTHGPCTGDEYKCGNGQCIPLQYTCDDYDDCEDQSDELGCCEFCSFTHPHTLYFLRKRRKLQKLSKKRSRYVSLHIFVTFLHLSLLDYGHGRTCSENLCEHNCTDLSAGGFICSCRPGYKPNPEDKNSCDGLLCRLNTVFIRKPHYLLLY